jgi:hypothetical protein
MTERRSGPREGRSNVEVATTDTSSLRPTSDIPTQVRRRREAADRLPPMADGQRDPLDPPTRHRCFECGRDLRLARFHRIDATRIVCRRCYRDRWAPR